MADKDTTLEFHDGGHDDVLFDQGKLQTHTFTDFPNSAESDDDEDKSQLLKEDKKQLSFWKFEYYQQFFDVETNQVFHRVVGSMLPLPQRNFLQTHIRPSPDLYGPFWICTTLVFTTAIAGNLANYLASGGKDYQWKYDFHKVTFSATAIFCYWWLVPTAIYMLLWWRKSQAGYTFLEIICVYGYSLAIYIPISILWVINYEWFKWILVIIGALLSGGVLVLTFWPAVKDDTKRVAIAAIGLIFLCHLLLASGFVLYFFHVPARTDLTTTTVSPTSIKPPEQPKNLPVKDQLNLQPAQSPKKNIDENTPADKEKDIDKEKDRKIDEKSEKPKNINENAETQKQSGDDIKNEKERSSGNNENVINPVAKDFSPVDKNSGLSPVDKSPVPNDISSVDKSPVPNDISPVDKNPLQNKSPVENTEGVKKRDIKIKAQKRRMNQEARNV